uniref:peroxidase n=1 Tax=Fagus sylvatica TaxID=28930 RepID=A0A2N9H5X0_FAGSY
MANRVLVFIVVLGCWTSAVSAALTADFYDGTCPGAIEEINKVVVKAVEHEPRMAASLVRLHFHDYFVMGCDASNLLDETPLMKTEKTTPPNNNFARGFEIIDEIKAVVDKKCGRPIVSCADILAVAARDAIVAVLSYSSTCINSC